MGQIERDFHSIWRGRFGDRAVGHDHFWERALSRREFLGTALATGAALSLPGLVPVIAEASDGSALPNPIRGGTQMGPFFKHFYFPTLMNPIGATKVVENGTGDGATIRDFNGFIGVSEFPPTGPASDPFFGGKFWAADIRFMKGQFVGQDNARHHGAVAFI
jgi:TAT (twin-arginine translocation) pathway signal sequence